MILNPNSVLPYISTMVAAIPIALRIQPNGIDLEVHEIHEISTNGACVPGDLDATTHQLLPWVDDGYRELIHLRKGSAYSLTAGDRFRDRLPAHMAAYVIGRSSFGRAGLLVRSSLYDSGYAGPLGAVLFAFTDTHIFKGQRFGQLIIHAAEAANQYNGQYLELQEGE